MRFRVDHISIEGERGQRIVWWVGAIEGSDGTIHEGQWMIHEDPISPVYVVRREPHPYLIHTRSLRPGEEPVCVECSMPRTAHPGQGPDPLGWTTTCAAHVPRAHAPDDHHERLPVEHRSGAHALRARHHGDSPPPTHRPVHHVGPDGIARELAHVHHEHHERVQGALAEIPHDAPDPLLAAALLLEMRRIHHEVTA